MYIRMPVKKIKRFCSNSNVEFRTPFRDSPIDTMVTVSSWTLH